MNSQLVKVATITLVVCTLLLFAVWKWWTLRPDSHPTTALKWFLGPLVYALIFGVEALIWTEGVFDGLAAMGLAGLLGVLTVQAFEKFFSVKLPERKSLEGTDILSQSEGVAWSESTRKTDTKNEARIGGISVPATVEPMGFLFSGSPGSGKTLAFLQLADSVRLRTLPAVVADLGAEYASMFYREKQDFILNPFDQRSQSWSPFAEMRSEVDAVALTWSMVPEGSGASMEWHSYARTILNVVLVRLFKADNPTNGELCYYLLTAPLAELAELCKGSVATSYFEPGNERMLGSVRAILCTYLQPYMHLPRGEGKDGFSIRRFVQKNADAWMFLTYREDQLKALRPLLAAQLDIASSALLSLETNLNRRLWFFLDEAYALGFVDSLVSLVSLGRKKGGCPVLGLQSITQLEEVYGQQKAETILNCLKNILMLYQSSNKNEDYMISLLCQRKVEESSTTETKTAGSMGGKSSSVTSQTKTEPALIKGQLRDLEPRHGILKLDGTMPPSRVVIPLAKRKASEVPFVDVKSYLPIHIERPANLAPTEPPSPPSPRDGKHPINFNV